MKMAHILPSLRCQCLDWSKVDALIDVPIPSSKITSPVGLSEALSFLKCPNGHAVGVTEVPGIFYHPGRRKWVVYCGKRYFGNRDASVDRATGALRIGKCTLKFHGGADFVDTDRMCFTRGTMVVNHFESHGVGSKKDVAILPASVVNPKYLDLVDLDLLGASPTKTHSGDWLFKIPLLDARKLVGNEYKPQHFVYEYVLPANQFDTIEDLHVEVWPDVEYECWRVFWLALERAPGEQAGFYDFEVFGCTKTDLGRRLTHGSLKPSSQYIAVEGRPRVVSLINRARDCGGTFLLLDPPSVKEPLANAAHPPVIALDFGTTRTAIGIPGSAGLKADVLVPDDTSEWATDAVLHMGLNHFGRAAIRAQLTQHSEQTVWVPTRDFPLASAGKVNPNVTYVGVIPSLLYLPSNRPDVKIPFVDFSIPAPKKTISDPTKIQSNLKWRTDAHSHCYREGYLKAALLIAVVQALHNFPSKDYQVRFSYPLAFSKYQFEQLVEAMKNAADWVGTCSGFNLQVLESGMDESSCAIEACGADLRGRWVLTADLGGGTLDLSLWDVTEQPSQEPLACDSVFFGADILTELWRKKVCPTTPLAHLQYDIFDKGWREEVRRASSDSSSAAGCPPAMEGFNAFFEGVVEYMSRFIAGTVKTHGDNIIPGVWVVLLGSGWRGYEASERFGDDLDSFKEILRTEISKRIKAIAGFEVKIDVYADVLQSRREKAAVVLGLLSLPLRNKPSQIKAPNGLDEGKEEGRGESVEWWQFVGKGGVIVPFGTTVLNSPALPKVLERYVPWLAKRDASKIAQLNSKRAHGKTSRERPVINDLYCYFLRNAIVEL